MRDDPSPWLFGAVWGLCFVIVLVWAETAGDNSIFDMSVRQVALVLFLVAVIAAALAFPILVAIDVSWSVIEWAGRWLREGEGDRRYRQTVLILMSTVAILALTALAAMLLLGW